MLKANNWKTYWGKQTPPLHRYNDENWYRLYAQEINLIIDSLGYKKGAVLETGCGNGALFDYLNINKEEYVGTDISESLLNIFRNKHPNLELICTDSSQFTYEKKFSLIFSNGVIQYFDISMLNSYIKNGLKMLDQDGIIILANIPWKDLKENYYSGELSIKLENNHNINNNILSVIKNQILELLGKRNSMGKWYNPRDFLQYQNHNLALYVFGSLFHPYRFSIAIKKLA